MEVNYTEKIANKELMESSSEETSFLMKLKEKNEKGTQGRENNTQQRATPPSKETQSRVEEKTKDTTKSEQGSGPDRAAGNKEKPPINMDQDPKDTETLLIKKLVQMRFTIKRK